MKDARNIPAIRFKEFSEAWEQRKLGDAVQITMGQSPSGDTYSSSPTDYILVQGNADLENGWVKPRVWTTQVTKKADAGDLIMSVRAPAGAMGKTSYDVVIGRGVASIKGNEFIFQTLVKLDENGYWKKLAAGSTFEAINSSAIFTATITMPMNEEEQLKIGDLFAHIDTLITLHQRKIDALKTLKKALLAEMFPDNGSDKPLLRFKGFNDAWEQRKLGEIGDVITGTTPNTNNSEYYSDDGIPWVTPTDIISDVTFSSAKKLSKSGREVARVAPKNSILVTCIASIGKNTILGTEGSFNQQINCIIPREKEFDPYFLYSESTIWSNEMRGWASSGTMQIVNKSEFSALVTYVPNYQEQDVVGKFFYKLDSLITLHQRKLEGLKTMKTFLLQNMFI